jgi:hypothetical protein
MDTERLKKLIVQPPRGMQLASVVFELTDRDVHSEETPRRQVRVDYQVVETYTLQRHLVDK